MKPQDIAKSNSYRAGDLYSNTLGTRILLPLGVTLAKLPAVLLLAAMWNEHCGFVVALLYCALLFSHCVCVLHEACGATGPD